MPLFITAPRKHASSTKEEGKPTPLRLAKPSKHLQGVQIMENPKEMEKVEQPAPEEIEAPKRSLDIEESCCFDSFFNIPEELQDYDEKYDCLDAITMAEIQFWNRISPSLHYDLYTIIPLHFQC